MPCERMRHILCANIDRTMLRLRGSMCAMCATVTRVALRLLNILLYKMPQRGREGLNVSWLRPGTETTFECTYAIYVRSQLQIICSCHPYFTLACHDAFELRAVEVPDCLFFFCIIATVSCSFGCRSFPFLFRLWLAFVVMHRSAHREC